MGIVAHTIIVRRFALVTLLFLLLWPLAGSAYAQVGQPDLVPTALVAPPSGDVTQPISVTWTVANQGTGQAYPNPTTWADEVFLSTDATYDSADRFVGNVNHTTPLPAGASYTVTQSFTLPVVPAGNYYLLLFTDALNVVPETNETNNVIAVPITVQVPDLVPTALVVSPSGDVTQPISFTWTVANQGTGQAYPNPTTWADEVFLSTDATYDSADRFVGNVNHTTPLPAGASYTVTQSFTLPIVPAGNYYLLLFTDALNVVPETNETNNVIAVPIVIGNNSAVPVPQPQPPNPNATPELDSLTLFGSALLGAVGYAALRRRAWLTR